MERKKNNAISILKNIKQNFHWSFLAVDDSYTTTHYLERSNYNFLRNSGLHNPLGHHCKVSGSLGLLHPLSSLGKEKQKLGSALAHEAEKLVIIKEQILFHKFL